MLPETFISKIRVDEQTGCWVWTGAKSKQGYGQYFWNGKTTLAHRAAFAMLKGYMPSPGQKVCHGCDNPSCVKPTHLFLGTQLENVRDMVAKGRGRWLGLKGQDNPRAKLTEAQVKEVLGSPAKGRDLAKRFGVAETTISAIRRGVNWTKRAEMKL